MSDVVPGMDNFRTTNGIVLDLGPGTGELLHLFNPDLIIKAYGPEPAVDMHPALEKNIEKAGLHGKYEILAAGAEPDVLIPALAKTGAIKLEGFSSQGIFDTICCMRVLCSVPHTEETIITLYKLLKPGGRIIISEHVVSPWPKRGSFLGFIWQKGLILVGWNFWMGGCTLNKDTLAMFEKAGGKDDWSNFDLNYVTAWHPIPFIVGTLTKSI
jgi:SAM-dependent methyltransferase